MDDRKQRIVIDRSLGEGERFFGWEVADAAALDALAAKLETAEVEVVSEPGTLADNRRVKRVISFRDPAGNRLEAFYGAEIDDAPFLPGRSISGFRTGPLGLGHAVLTVENIDAVMPFYVDLLGFQLSDYMQKPFRAFFLPHQCAASQPRFDRDRPQRHAPSDGRAVFARRRRPVL
jgi:catechol 2,3-dioxygenase-like lactoylglutathione lyase family enzyme